jgi:hypothetical protein
MRNALLPAAGLEGCYTSLVRPLAPNHLRQPPRRIYEIHADRASGLSVPEIAAKHNLPATAVLGLLRSSVNTCALANPYEFRRRALGPLAEPHAYWLGYIAATGRVLGQNNFCTLVLAIHPDDAPHIQTLLSDLVVGRTTCEFANSSLSGRQVYVRDRPLAETLLQWGIAATLEESSIPLEFVPVSLMPHFVRGYLEGGRLSPPFGGTRREPPSPRAHGALSLVGSPPLIAQLKQALQQACRAYGGVVTAFEPGGLARLVFPSPAGIRILEYAYRRPTRTGPRAAKFVSRFSA